ncbi:MAG: NTP transferase domain-containing protein [Candidatus Bathyarchaeota archaeon]|nr:MAG: NTP transferase domain-containing protein [Candidatus Bathyarchaeota archaeon]UCE57970.1 MAG: NTP transferase domain-containing protein [Candidatus Bathyarchaeota archaeon]
MRVVALIMAGGRGKRFGGDIEKPMIKLLGKPLIKWVIEATKASRRLSETYVAVTSYNSRTGDEAARSSATTIQTKGLGYHADLRQAVLKLNLTCPVLTTSSDLPLLNGEFLDDIIGKYEESRKSALTVLVPIETCRKYGLCPTSFYEHEGNTYAVSGINMIDGRRILEEQQQEVIICRKPEAIFNINTPKDLESAKNYLLQNRKT